MARRSAPKSDIYFRDKRLATRQRFHQKYLRPLAAWIEAEGPADILVTGFLFACFWIAIRLAVVNFYGLIAALPWVIMAIACILALASWSLRRGRHDGY